MGFGFICTFKVKNNTEAMIDRSIGVEIWHSKYIWAMSEAIYELLLFDFEILLRCSRLEQSFKFVILNKNSALD